MDDFVTSPESTYGVRIARGLITRWKGEPITSRAIAAECLGVIEEWTSERGVIVRATPIGQIVDACIVDTFPCPSPDVCAKDGCQA